MCTRRRSSRSWSSFFQGRPLNHEISARVESKRDIVLRRNSNVTRNPLEKRSHLSPSPWIHYVLLPSVSFPLFGPTLSNSPIESKHSFRNLSFFPSPAIINYIFLQIHPSFSKRSPFNNIEIGGRFHSRIFPHIFPPLLLSALNVTMLVNIWKTHKRLVTVNLWLRS